MEYKIGEIFEYNGEWYQCANQNGCCNCAFYNTPCHLMDELSCDSLNKKRKERYIFKKLEKVGEPTMLDGKLVQKILTTDRYSCNGCCFESPECDKADNDLCCVHEIYVEIKQNKEDMEENNNAKHSNTEKIGKNLKPFDLQAAKSGKPVCTRDGKKARIICFDVKWSTHPIIALIEEGEDERLCSYMPNGRRYEDEEEWKDDLMMLPEKKEGWVNLHRNEFRSCYINSGVYSSKQEAYSHIHNEEDYLDTIKISWEE